MLKTVNVSEYFKVQIGTKFPFSFKLIFFSLLVKRIILLYTCMYLKTVESMVKMNTTVYTAPVYVH